jgi:hypothetical protein
MAKDDYANWPVPGFLPEIIDINLKDSITFFNTLTLYKKYTMWSN